MPAVDAAGAEAARQASDRLAGAAPRGAGSRSGVESPGALIAAVMARGRVTRWTGPWTLGTQGASGSCSRPAVSGRP